MTDYGLTQPLSTSSRSLILGELGVNQYMQATQCSVHTDKFTSSKLTSTFLTHFTL